jgi:hypothetical protein
MDFGLDNLVRLGVSYIWIGVESSSEVGNYSKNKGSDPKQLVKELRDRGIIVLASGILCMEHHTPENIGRDIDFMVELEADFVQYMLLTPMPVTALYREHQRRGLLREDLPYEEWHGQNELSYNHPHFPGDSAARWIKTAFRREYEKNSSSIFRVIETSLRGYRRMAAMGPLNDCLAARRLELERRVREWSPMLPTLARNAVNETERNRALMLEKEIAGLFPRSLKYRAKRAAIRTLAAVWKKRLSFLGDAIQPATIVTRYPPACHRGIPVIQYANAAPVKQVEVEALSRVG